jgi:hypothetical protein
VTNQSSRGESKVLGSNPGVGVHTRDGRIELKKLKHLAVDTKCIVHTVSMRVVTYVYVCMFVT